MGKVALKPKKKLDGAARERLNLAKKLSRLRKRERAGGGLSPEERALLEAHPKKVAGRPTVEETAEREVAPQVETEIEEGETETTPPTDASPPPPPRFDPPKEPPPRVRHAARSGDWRDKYRSEGHGGDDREATCLMAAHFGVVVPLKKAADYIRASGGRPAFDDAFIDGPIRNLAVLVADKYLPDGVAVPIEAELGVLAGTVLGQAFLCYLKGRKAPAPPPRAKERAPEQAPPPPGNERPVETKPTNGAPPNPIVDAPQLPAGRFEVKPDTYI